MRLMIITLVFLVAVPLRAFALAEPVQAQQEIVVTANPLATEAGVQALAAGGSAVDAMIAAQAVLGLVEPQSSGIGGGAFLVYFDAETGTTTTFDAREMAPAAASPDRFLEKDGTPMGFVEAWQSGLSVGVPGVPRLLHTVHERYGLLPLADLLEPAVGLARGGFALSERTSTQVRNLLANNESCQDNERLFFRDPVAFGYFVDTQACTAKPAGTRMLNPDYAETLVQLGLKGAAGFYRGETAAAIVAGVRTDPAIKGDLSTADLADYQVIERPPVCVDYRSYRVCGMGPPSSGGIAVGQILGILANFDLDRQAGPLAVEAVHLFSQAGRLAFADRNLYVADSDYVTVPVAGLLDERYLAERAALITGRDMGAAEPGTPPGDFDPAAPDARAKASGTSHLSIIDRYGNALSMTTSVEASFGNGVMVQGFLLNNQLTDFSFTPALDDGTPIANRVEPGKRPRSSMSPTLVFDSRGKVRFVTGSPGGSRIIGYTAQSLVNLIDFDLGPQQSINVPHYMNRNGSTDLEAPLPGITLEYDVEALAAALMERGHETEVLPQTSGLSIISVQDGLYSGGRDLRRDGAAGGR